MRAIDLNTWPRQQHFKHFLTYARPFSTICVRQDVSALVAYTRASGRSRFGVMCHAVMWALNQVEQLRQRVIEAQPYQLDKVDVSFTALAQDGEHFNFCTASFDDELTTFLTHVQQAIAQGQAQAAQGPTLFTGDDHHINLAYVTCLPWLDFSALEHAFLGDGTDFIPRIAWGKMVERGPRVEVSVSLSAHHALVDGLHIARFFECLEHYISQLQSE